MRAMEPTAELVADTEELFVPEMDELSVSFTPRTKVSVNAVTWPYYVTSAAAGFSMMGLEILAGPMLEPAFGGGNDVWAGIISVFILSLSVGYVLGGRLVDRWDARRSLGAVLLVAGLYYAILPLFAWEIIDWMVATIPRMRIGALFASMLLFFLPSLLVGMVSPMLVKLSFIGVEALGRTTGVIYAVAAIGNVAGVLICNFLLLELMGVGWALALLGSALVVVGAAHLAVSR
jgi:MFS family permease